MTDNKIIKALEEMEEYPHYYEEGQILKNVLDLINRQKAEIERLKKEKDEYSYLYDKHINTAFSHIKAEAYKEFAYELKRIPRISVYKNEIDNLLKEKVGEDNGKEKE